LNNKEELKLNKNTKKLNRPGRKRNVLKRKRKEKGKKRKKGKNKKSITSGKKCSLLMRLEINRISMQNMKICFNNSLIISKSEKLCSLKTWLLSSI
jgi:hypothetical protein